MGMKWLLQDLNKKVVDEATTLIKKGGLVKWSPILGQRIGDLFYAQT